MPNNYGDVALNLSADWSRDNLASGHEFMLTSVGHENGKADVHLKEDPDKRHQFQWCALTDVDRFHALRAKKYDYVKGSDLPESAWVKNSALWEWDAEGYVAFKGQRLMVRDGALFIAEKKERERTVAADLAERKRRRGDYVDRDDDYAIKRLAAQGVAITDDEGRELRPIKKQAGR